MTMICISEDSNIQPANEKRIERDNLVLLIRGAQGYLVDIDSELVLHEPDIPFNHRAAAVLYRGLGFPLQQTKEITYPQYRSSITFSSVRYENRDGN